MSYIMTTTEKTVTLINPWTKTNVDCDVGPIAKDVVAYCWPQHVLETLDGECDSDEEWVCRAVEIMGPEQSGIVIIGG